MRPFLTLFIALFISTNIVFSQDQTTIISATVFDIQTKKPVQQAVVSLKNTNLSIVTNQDGYFTLKILSDRITARDSVSVSYLGYATVTLPVTTLIATENRKGVEIFLHPVSYSLDPAIITPNDPAAIFDLAFSRIKNNFVQENVSMTAFYREVFRKGNRDYLSLNEAVIDINKAGYRFFGSNNRVALYKGRSSSNIEKEDSLFFVIRGGPLSTLDLDIVGDPFIGVYLHDTHRFYDFTFGEAEMIDDKLFYTLIFNEKYSPDIHEYYKGKIYIEKETYAIGRIEFEIDMGKTLNAERYFVKEKPRNYNFDIISVKYLVNYKQNSDGLWNFSYSRFDMELNAYKRFSLFKKRYYITSELAITDISSHPIEIAQSDRLRYSDIIGNKISDFVDDDFWREYNIIEPDQTIEVIINRIIRQLKREDRRR